MENKLWNFLKRIAHGEPVDQEQLEGISEALERGWEAYEYLLLKKISCELNSLKDWAVKVQTQRNVWNLLKTTK